jgi:hypothetical protein
MSVGYEWEAAPPKLPRDGIAEIVEALLRIHVMWAPVTKVVSHGLAVVERFVIEAALDLGEITAEDVAEVTGLPPDLSARIVARAAAVGVLELAVDGTYRPVPEAAADALTRAELREFHRAQLTFMYLAGTDELLALDSAPPRLDRLAPVHQAPLRGGLAGSDIAGFLNARITAGTVMDLPDWVYDAVPCDERIPETCPAYRCRGRLKEGGVVLDLLDAEADQRRIRLPRATPGLREWLTSAADSLDGAFDRWDEPPPQRLSRFAFGLPGGLSRKVMDSGLALTRDVGLCIQDEEVTARVAVSLVPEDDEARATFALDHAVSAVLAVRLEELEHRKLAETAAAAGVEYGHAPAVDTILDEIWRRRHFFQIYLLRASDDFDYD